MKKRFELDEKDIAWGWHGSAAGLRRKLARTSAAVDVRSSYVSLKHIPTGVEIRAEVPLGHYSNREMRSAREQLRAELQEQLRVMVARHLRIRGQ